MEPYLETFLSFGHPRNCRPLFYDHKIAVIFLFHCKNKRYYIMKMRLGSCYKIRKREIKPTFYEKLKDRRRDLIKDLYE